MLKNRHRSAALLLGLSTIVSTGCLSPAFAQETPIAKQSPEINPMGSSETGADNETTKVSTQSATVIHDSATSTPTALLSASTPTPITASTSAQALQSSRRKKETPYHGWGFLKPVYNLELEVGHLEREVEKLNAPLRALQPGAITLTDQLSRIQSQTNVLFDRLGTAHEDVSGLQGQMEAIDQRLDSLKQPVTKMLGPLGQLKDEVSDLRLPVSSLKAPISELRQPISELRNPINKLYAPLHSVDTQMTSLGKRFSKLDKHFADLDGRFVDLDARFGDLHGRFANLDHRFSELDGRLSDLGKQLGALNTVLQTAMSAMMVIFIATAITIVVGIIVAAIVLRRKSRTILTRFVPSRTLSKIPD